MSTLSPAVHLLFPLVAGETRLVIPLEETVLSAALKPASDRSQRLIVFVHGAASNASFQCFAVGRICRYNRA